MTKPKCYCTQQLNSDGTCPYRCPPNLRRPGLRNRKIEGCKPPSSIIAIDRNAVTNALKKLDPVFAARSAEQSIRSKRTQARARFEGVRMGGRVSVAQ